MGGLEEALAIPREEVLPPAPRRGQGSRDLRSRGHPRPAPAGRRGPAPGTRVRQPYDQYKGVVAYVRLTTGTLHDHERIRFIATGAESRSWLRYFRRSRHPRRGSLRARSATSRRG